MTVPPDTNADAPNTLPKRVRWLGLTFARSEQPLLFALMLICAAGMAVYFWRQSIEAGGLIDIDQLPQRTAVYQVDINAAPWPELVNLPGVGPHLAMKIVDDRSLNGPFDDIDSIQRVSGIGPRKLAAMRSFLLPVGPQQPTASSE